jgi:hypothetical protein
VVRPVALAVAACVMKVSSLRFVVFVDAPNYKQGDPHRQAIWASPMLSMRGSDP